MLSTHRKVFNAVNRYLGGVDSPYTAPFPEEVNFQEFRRGLLRHSLLRKAEFTESSLSVDEDPLHEEAISSFLKIEQRLSRLDLNPQTFGPVGRQREVVIHTAREKILKVLGSFDLDEMVGLAGFSNGASTRLRRKSGAPPHKYEGKPHVTANCRLLAVSAIWHSPVWRAYFQDLYGRESDPFTWVQVVRGSEYFTVPKHAQARRGCCKEPDLNMYLQRGIGSMIRRRLKRVGVDLNDQTLNQRLALIGSRTGSLCTIDLEAASDSVALDLCQLLLPADWFRFMCMTRSTHTRIDGRWHNLQKISSMGNGFTFELESLIFWALSQGALYATGCEDRRIGVYGDDIVIHNSAAETLIEALSFCGFITNKSKTWLSGPYRESCGKHYYYGADTTPFFVKNALDSAAERYHFVNRLNMWLQHDEGDYKPLLDYVVRQLFPKGWLPVPPHLGTKAGMLVPSVQHAEGIYFSLFHEKRVRVGPPMRIYEYGYSILALEPKPNPRSKVPQWGGYMTALQTPSEVVVVEQEKGVRYRLRRRIVSEWSNCEVTLVQTVRCLGA